ncbi:MAG: ATP-binding protein [Acidimicrobiales bacterium]
MTGPDYDEQNLAVDAAIGFDLAYAEDHSSLSAFTDLHFRIASDGTYLRVWALDPTVLMVPPDEIPGTNIADYFPPSLAARMLNAITSTISTSGVNSIEYSLHEDGGLHHYEVRIAPLGNDDVMAVVRDISSLKELEQQLVHAETMQSIGRLAGGIAHDFNNVLHVIRGQAQALHGHRDDAEEMDRRIEAITRAVDRTSSLVERLMILSRPTADNPSPTDVDSFLQGLGPTLHQLLGETIELEFVLDGRDSAVVIDDSRFENVLLNLATNALDAMADGGALRIATAVAGDDSIVLTVSDTGMGIEPTALPHVFDPFFTTKAAGIGTGLGLATTYSSIAEAGGSVTVDSELGVGTTFVIELPTTDEKPVPDRPAEPLERRSTDATILVVEDEPDVLQLCGDALRAMGFEVLEALNGADALALIDDGRAVDLVLTDVVMPIMAGPELAREIASRHGDVPVVFMSGYAYDTRVGGLGLSPANVLRKPFTEDELRVAVAGQLVDLPAGETTTEDGGE